MLKKEPIWNVKNVIAGALAGGILGALLIFLSETGVLVIPGFKSILAVSPFNKITTGAAIGIIIGGGIGNVTGKSSSKQFPVSEQVVYDTDHKTTLKILEEQLDITKKPIQTGEVSLHKKQFKEEKTITVPITREELIIEKKTFGKEDPNRGAGQTETIRIPLSEERVEVSKHPVVLNKVSVYKHQFQETEHVEETVKREKLDLETTGDPKINNKNY